MRFPFVTASYKLSKIRICLAPRTPSSEIKFFSLRALREIFRERPVRKAHPTKTFVPFVSFVVKLSFELLHIRSQQAAAVERFGAGFEGGELVVGGEAQDDGARAGFDIFLHPVDYFMP